MPQLVGLNCIRCGERIADELESRFCRQCGSPVHDRCARPTETGGCSVCGAAVVVPEPVNIVVPSHPTKTPESPELWGPISFDPSWVLLRIGLGSILGGVLLAVLFYENGEGWGAIGLAVLSAIAGVLLLVHVRWAPELLAAVFAVFILLAIWAIMRGGDAEPLGIFAACFGFGLVVVYPRARAAMRELKKPNGG